MHRALLALSLLLLVGCSSSVEFSEDSRRDIRTISIRSDVDVAGDYSGTLPGVDVSTRGEVWYSFWFTAPVGVVVDLIDWSDNAERRRDAFAWQMAQADVAVDAIARAELEKELEDRRTFEGIWNWGADAELILSVDYGLDDGMGMRGSWKPWLSVEATLVRDEGEVVWRRREEVEPSDSRLAEFVHPFSHPDQLRTGFQRAARLVAASLVDDLEGS